MKYFYHMDKKRTNASVLKDLGEYCIFPPLGIKGKTIEKQYPFGTYSRFHKTFAKYFRSSLTTIEVRPPGSEFRGIVRYEFLKFKMTF